MAKGKKRKAIVMEASLTSTSPAVNDGLNYDCPTLPVIDTSSDDRDWVWEHVTKCFAEVTDEVQVKDGKKETVELIVLKVKCNYCDTLMDCEVKGGTSTYIKHILKSCKKYKSNADFQQRTLSSGGCKTLVDGDLRSTLTSRAWNQVWSQEACVKSIVEFIVINEQPFSVAEKMGFRQMMNICVPLPLLHVHLRRSIVREFWKYYDQAKTDLMMDLRKYGVSFTMDTWTSVQNINYMVLTAHFVDDEWVMHKKILNFCTIPSLQGKEIGKLIEQCLIEWKVEKIMCISVDNTSANKVAIDWLVGKMRNWPKSPLILEGKYIHVRCLTRVMNLVVKDGLARMDNSVASIRKAVKFVRSSPSRFEYYKKCMHAENIDGSGLLVMDVTAQWNSTYLMLESVLKYRKVFDRMYEDENTFYKSYFNEKDDDSENEEDVAGKKKEAKAKVAPPKEEDWDNAATFCAFLKVLYLVTMQVSASSYPTSHAAIHNVMAVETEIAKLFIPHDMQTGSVVEQLPIDMAVGMTKKYKKYFGSVATTNRLFVVALVLDPRFKLRHYHHLCKMKLGYTDKEAEDDCNEVKALMKQLCAEYSEFIDSSQTRKDKQISSGVMCSSSASQFQLPTTASNEIQSDFMDDWEKKLQASEDVVLSDDVDCYLIDRLEANDKSSGFDILNWWKVKGKNWYPTLALVAKDILPVQVSTMASESAFSTEERVIDPFRSSLTPKSVEALICYQNWLTSEDISNVAY
ncbi:hypothetical protein ACHQM5_016753 [Ranunculus cassubicifolius]